jgi:uncharacterized membrane protein
MPRAWILALIVFCVVLNAAGFVWNLFEPVPFYDEVAHLVTPFVLVAIAAEVVYRAGGDDVFFDTPGHALATGAAIGFFGAVGWEVIEVLLDFMGFTISHAPLDTVFDVFLGVIGGAAGAWVADRYLDRLFGRHPRNSSVPRRAPRVR